MSAEQSTACNQRWAADPHVHRCVLDACEGAHQCHCGATVDQTGRAAWRAEGLERLKRSIGRRTPGQEPSGPPI